MQRFSTFYLEIMKFQIIGMDFKVSIENQQTSFATEKMLNTVQNQEEIGRHFVTYGQFSGVDTVVGAKPTDVGSWDDLGTNPETWTAAQTPHSRQLSFLKLVMFFRYNDFFDFS